MNRPKRRKRTASVPKAPSPIILGTLTVVIPFTHEFVYSPLELRARFKRTFYCKAKSVGRIPVSRSPTPLARTWFDKVGLSSPHSNGSILQPFKNIARPRESMELDFTRLYAWTILFFVFKEGLNRTLRDERKRVIGA